jgi:hypothetical protein
MQKSKNKKANELWQLLDDIDTYTDRIHPVNGEESMQNWYNAVQKIINRRFSVLESDGFRLFVPQNQERNP